MCVCVVVWSSREWPTHAHVALRAIQCSSHPSLFCCLQVIQVRKKDTGEVLAMKILNKSTVIAKRQVEHTQAERAILESMDHPFLLKLRYAFQTKGSLYLVLPYISGGELFQRLRVHRVLPEEWVHFYAAEIALGIGHLHECGIVFRDIKPENVLIDASGHVVLTDFGLAKVLDEAATTTTTFCGTPEYIAPEMVEGNPHTFAVDWYALGLLVWELLAGTPPFTSRTNNVKDLYAAIREGPPPFPHHFSPLARSFISQLVQKDPTLRLGCRVGDGGVEAIKAHPFFEGMDWEALLARRVTPPWVPPVQDAADATHFDPEFTSLPMSSLYDHGAVPASHASGKSHSSLPQFEGFSYGSLNSTLGTSVGDMGSTAPAESLLAHSPR